MGKKALSLLVMLVLIFCNSVDIYGATSTKNRTAKSDDGSTWIYYDESDNLVSTDGDGKESDGSYPNGQNITAGFDISGADTVYCVDVSWGDMQYTYSAGSGAVWDPKTHKYSSGTGGGWNPVNGGNTVTVMNHSNDNISVELLFTQNAAAGLDPITSSFTESDEFELDSAEGTEYDECPQETSSLTLSGNPGFYFEEGTVIGTVTVNLSFAEE